MPRRPPRGRPRGRPALVDVSEESGHADPRLRLLGARHRHVPAAIRVRRHRARSSRGSGVGQSRYLVLPPESCPEGSRARSWRGLVCWRCRRSVGSLAAATSTLLSTPARASRSAANEKSHSREEPRERPKQPIERPIREPAAAQDHQPAANDADQVRIATANQNQTSTVLGSPSGRARLRNSAAPQRHVISQGDRTAMPTRAATTAAGLARREGQGSWGPGLKAWAAPYVAYGCLAGDSAPQECSIQACVSVADHPR